MNLREFRRILQITLTLPLILLLLLALVLAWGIERTFGEQRRIDHSDGITTQLNEAQRLIADEASGLRRYQLSHDSLTLAPYRAANAPLEDALNRLAALVQGDPKQELRLQRLRGNQAIWRGIADRILVGLDGGEPSQDRSLDANEKRTMDSLRAQVHDMLLIEAGRRHRLIESTDTAVQTLTAVLLVSLIGLGIFLGVFTQRNLKKVSHAFRSSLDEEHQRADELFKSRQWLQTTLESVGDALIACDRHGKIELMNPVAQDLTGWKLSEAQGRSLLEVVRILDQTTRTPLQIPAAQSRTKNIAAGLANHSVLVRKDGGESIIEDSVAPILGVAGEVTGLVLVLRDVTERRQAEAALLAYEKLAVAGRLAASIAHEIHNPLDAVANLHYLMERETDPVQQHRYLAMAQQELNRTLQISRAMLGLYREPKAPVEVNLRELLESVLLLLDHRLKDESIEVQRSLDAAVTVEGFPGELRQVFVNLLTNAADAAGTGGQVRVRLKPAAPIDRRPGAAVIVADNGAGIPEGMEEKLFQPFFTTKGEHGTGLGLWISRGIVEKHGGTLSIANSTDSEFRGAVVRVYLPAHVLPVSSPAPARASAS